VTGEELVAAVPSGCRLLLFCNLYHVRVGVEASRRRDMQSTRRNACDVRLHPRQRARQMYGIEIKRTRKRVGGKDYDIGKTAIGRLFPFSSDAVEGAPNTRPALQDQVADFVEGVFYEECDVEEALP
jgi:hypothetical protein